MALFVTSVSIFLIILAFLCLISAYLGPTVVDRIVSINLIGTKTVIVMALVGYITNSPYYLDVALVYALIAFLATLGLAKFLEKGHLG